MGNDISDALRSAKSLTALLKQFDGYEAYGELMSAATNLQEQISEAIIANATSAQEKVALIQRADALSKENEQLKHWASTSQDYALKNLGYGAFAMVYQPLVQSAKPPHWACAKCFEDQKISVLQRKMRVGYFCPRCDLELSNNLIKETL